MEKIGKKERGKDTNGMMVTKSSVLYVICILLPIGDVEVEVEVKAKAEARERDCLPGYIYVFM